MTLSSVLGLVGRRGLRHPRLRGEQRRGDRLDPRDGRRLCEGRHPLQRDLPRPDRDADEPSRTGRSRHPRPAARAPAAHGRRSGVRRTSPKRPSTSRRRRSSPAPCSRSTAAGPRAETDQVPRLLLLLAPPRLSAPAPRLHSRRRARSASPGRGRSSGGVQLPAEGEHFFTWDNVRRRSPNGGSRRYANARLIRTTLRVLGAVRRRPPGGAAGRLRRPLPAARRRLRRAIRRPRPRLAPERARRGRLLPASRPPGAPAGGAAADRPPPRSGAPRPVRRGRRGEGLRRPEHRPDRPAGGRRGAAGPPRQPHARAARRETASRSELVGESTRGQPIRAFTLGSGRPRILVVGTVHGNEPAGSVVATRLLHARPPARGSITVVQDLNPTATPPSGARTPAAST